MDKIVYIRDFDSENSEIQSKEPTRIEFDLNPDLTIYEYLDICRRMAAALGYQSKSIIEAFGHEVLKSDQSVSGFLEQFKSDD